MLPPPYWPPSTRCSRPLRSSRYSGAESPPSPPWLPPDPACPLWSWFWLGFWLWLWLWPLDRLWPWAPDELWLPDPFSERDPGRFGVDGEDGEDDEQEGLPINMAAANPMASAIPIMPSRSATEVGRVGAAPPTGSGSGIAVRPSRSRNQKGTSAPPKQTRAAAVSHPLPPASSGTTSRPDSTTAPRSRWT